MSESRTVGELVLDLREAHRRMGVKNPHRALVGQAAFAIVYLSQQVEHLKKMAVPDVKDEPRVVLATEIGHA